MTAQGVPTSLMRGKARPGVQYAVLSAVLRNAGSPDYWQPIEYTTANGSRVHNMTGLDSTTPSQITADNKVKINYSQLGATAVSSLIVTPDNDMVYAGLICGVSVATDSATITIARFCPYVDEVFWNGSAFVMNRAGNSPFTVGSFAADGTLTLSHPDLGSTGGFGAGGTTAFLQASLTGRGPYVPVLSPATGAAGYTSMGIQWLGPSGNPILTADANCRCYISRGGGADNQNSLDARLVGLGSENIWVYGLMEVPA